MIRSDRRTGKRTTLGFVVLAALLAAFLALGGSSRAQARPIAGDEPYFCTGCKPPLKYFGGPVLDTRGPQGLTVTPVYWAPPGVQNRFPGNYQAIVNRYIADVAAASGTDTNVYSILTEYYDIFGGQIRPIRYHIAAGSPVVDTKALPPNGCKPTADGTNACITDEQLTAELDRVLAARHLPRGPAYFYPVFLPQGLDSVDGTDRYADNYCAYHGVTGGGPDQVAYGNEPYGNGTRCHVYQSPNGNPAADSAIDPLSHELAEATTDPGNYNLTAWREPVQYQEIGDICAYHFGPPIGSTDPARPQETLFNQVINGGHYYTQTEFSNYAYNRFGTGVGCQPSESAARGPSAPAGSSVAHLYANVSPSKLSADGHSRSSIFVQVQDKDGYAVSNDRVSFAEYSLDLDGTCGTLTHQSAVTDSAGTVEVTYRASRSNIACGIVATDALGGRSVSGVVYQGRSRASAPRAGAAFPKVVRTGRRAIFTTAFTNRTTDPIGNSQVNLLVYARGEHSPSVRARQIHISVSWHGRRGPFRPVRLSGSTGEAGISGVIGGPRGFKLRGRHKLTLTYRIRVSKTVPRHRRRAILQFEAFLDQVNPATGADTALADTDTTNTKVR